MVVLGTSSFFNTEFFEDCSSFDPPLTLDCLIDLWLDAVGCTEDGTSFPENLEPQDLTRIWGDKNQK